MVRLFQPEGRSLVRLARLFVDDRDAAEDIVQEAFLRLARHAGRIGPLERAPAYLRSIVLNLARDHNRRGLVSLRHHATSGREVDVGATPPISSRAPRSINACSTPCGSCRAGSATASPCATSRSSRSTDRFDARAVGELGEDAPAAGDGHSAASTGRWASR